MWLLACADFVSDASVSQRGGPPIGSDSTCQFKTRALSVAYWLLILRAL